MTDDAVSGECMRTERSAIALNVFAPSGGHY